MLKESDKLIFNRLFQSYYGPFCIYAQRFIDNWEACEDIVSDVFATLWMNREEVCLEENTALGYIKVCVRNKCLNIIKHRNVKSKYIEESLFLSQNSNCSEEIHTLDELYEQLHKTLQLLPDEQQKVFIRTYFDGKSQQEIAEELNISVKTVGRHKKRTIDFLKDKLKDYTPLILLLNILSI
ncbi:MULTISPECIES: RNA polymerase sigma-70 factor [Bacteroides]|uniref:RNA polymerase sigma-70 factor n=1 Tax=Bacteroides TaxID=816 RepID=UPI001DFB05A3|nr:MULTISPECIES: RNA polymerase sigma-70 factor [Bacteroides]HJD91894.1 RNA polymerase sigma-70 factor [Bacteroides coprosuis]